MCCAKAVGFFLLAIYLILQGVVPLFEVTPGMVMHTIFGLLGIVSGILLLVSLGHCHCPHCSRK